MKTIGTMKLFPVVLGTDVYGTDVGEQIAFSLMDYYVDLGGNVLDTARSYAVWHPGGLGKSEETIGKWLKQSGKRNQILISTKCAHFPNGVDGASRLSEEQIRRDVEQSLTALGVNEIDILWLHRDSQNVPVDGVIEALNRLVQEGKIRSFGASNWKAKRMEEANQYAALHGLQGFCAGQIKWSLAKTSPDYSDDPALVEMNPEEYRFYEKNGLGLFAFASQAKGFFSKYALCEKNNLPFPESKAKNRYLCEENKNRYQQLTAYCRENSIPLESAVLGAIVSNTDFETVAIVGCKSLEQLESSMRLSQAEYLFFRKMMFGNM